MTSRDDLDLDRWLREADAVEPAEVDGLVTAALTARPRAHVGRGTYASAAAGVLLALAAVILVVRRPLPPPAQAGTSFTATQVGELIVLEAEDGTAWIVGPQSPEAASEPGTLIVIEEGDDR